MTAHTLDRRPASLKPEGSPRGVGVGRVILIGLWVLALLAGGTAWMHFAMAPMIDGYTVSD